MKYVNPGLKILCQSTGINEITDYNKNPINGHSLYGDFVIEFENLGKDIFCKFDVYCQNKNNFYFYFRGLNGYLGEIYIDTSDDSYFIYQRSRTTSLSNIINYLTNNDINHFFIHFNLGTFDMDEESWTGGNIELRINDYIFTANLGNILDENIYSSSSQYFNFKATSNCPVSNIIISDEEIDSKEQIVILPVTSIDTDMTDNNDGSYTATKEDQYILQTVDAANLISKFGRKSEITSIIIAGLPAYKTTDGLSSLISIESNNNNIIEGTTKTLETYYGDDDYYDEHKILITKNISNMTLNDLTGKQYGFKVGV